MKGYNLIELHRLAIIGFMALVVMGFVMSLAGCSSPKYIPIETKVLLKDSVITRDSLIIREKEIQRDSVVTRDSTVLVVDEEGNVVRTELYRYRDRYKDLSRYYSSLQVKYDSLLSVKQREVQVPYPVEIEKKLTWSQKIKIELGGYAFGAVIGLLIIILFMYRAKKI